MANVDPTPQTVIHIDSVPLFTTERGIRARQVLNTAPYRIMNIVLEPGQTIPKHTSPVDVFFYVLTGSGEISIGATAHTVRANDILPCPKDTDMSLQAGDKGLSVLNVKAPNPATLSQ